MLVCHSCFSIAILKQTSLLTSLTNFIIFFFLTLQVDKYSLQIFTLLCLHVHDFMAHFFFLSHCTVKDLQEQY